MSHGKKKLAIVVGTVPLGDEIDQFRAISSDFDLVLVSSESISAYLKEVCFFDGLTILSLPDHDDSSTFLPGLEQILVSMDLVIVKDRVGLFSYQALKAKWRYKFQLVVWVDNATPFIGQDITQVRTVRDELIRGADCFMVQSSIVEAALLMEGVEKDRIYKITPSVQMIPVIDRKNKFKTKEKFNYSERDFIVCYRGDIEWEEGLFELLYALKHLNENDSFLKGRVRLVVSGIGELASELKQRSIQLSVDNYISYLVPNRASFVEMVELADCFYVSPIQSPIRHEGNPYRYLTAMAYGIPVVSARNGLSQEYLEKQRIDFCQGSISSLALAIKKSFTEKALVHTVVEKCKAKVTKNYQLRKTQDDILQMVESISKPQLERASSEIDKLVLEIESKVSSKQYLVAINLIEGLFEKEDLPPYHQANLFRLIGDCFTKLGDKEAGKNAYIQSVEFDPYSPRAHIGLGTISLMKQNFDIAVIHFQKAVSIAPNDEMALLGLGLAFQGLDELKEAAKWVVKSLNINPDNTGAIYSLVRIATDREEFSEAEKALRNYLNRHPNDYDLRFSLSGILFRMGRFEEVKQELKQITDHDPMDSRAMSLLKQTDRAISRETSKSAHA